MADTLLEKHLEAFGATLIEGPKWCGKTTTASQKAASILRMQDPDTKESFMATAATKPSLLLKGATPRLIDEWQDAPVLWDAVRIQVDDRQKTGQFILTGSNSVDKSKIMHSGTGRISRMKMYPMSLFESQESTGEVSLKALFDDPDYDIDGKTSQMEVEDLIFAACRGGWPASVLGNSREAQLMVANEYLESVCDTDVSRVDNVRRNPELTRVILRTYARNLSTLAMQSTMLKDVKANVEGCTDTTFDSYLTALKKIFVIEDAKAWCPAVRSSKMIRQTPKREFTDPSIAVAALGLSPESLETDLKTFGFIFECMCLRDLRAYSQALGSSIEYYHDRYGLEADFVLHLRDGRYALIECKLGSQEIEKGAEHLLELKNLVRQYNEKEKQMLIREPDLLIVITGGKMAFTREDGVKVIPLGCLTC